MSSRHWLLRVPEHPATDARWSWVDASREPALVDTGTLAEFVTALQAGGARQPVVALLPASQVLSVPVTVPQRQQRQLLAALPFLLEESLASDIERCHVVAGARIDATRLQALAVARDTLDALLATLQAAGVDPDIVTADALALPAGTLYLDASDSLLASADGHALAIHENDVGAVLAGLALPHDANLRILLGEHGQEAGARAVESDCLAREVPVAVHVDEQPRPLLAHLAALAPAAWSGVANLRQGSYARAGSGGFAPGFDWRPLAWLAACWAVVALGYQLAVGVSYLRAADATLAAQVELYKQVFPGSSNVPRPRQQMEGQIGSGAARNDLFVSLVARTAGAMDGLGGAAAGYRPGNLAWDGSQRQLRMDVVARNLEDLDRLRAALEQQGLVVDIGAGIAQEGGYKARLNVGEGA